LVHSLLCRPSVHSLRLWHYAAVYFGARKNEALALVIVGSDHLFLVILFGVSGYMLYVYILLGVWWIYASLLVGIILVMVLITVATKKTHHLHVHHNTVRIILVLLIGYQSIPATIIQGWCNGMMMEGSAR
jgi:hypothetical protein